MPSRGEPHAHLAGGLAKVQFALRVLLERAGTSFSSRSLKISDLIFSPTCGTMLGVRRTMFDRNGFGQSYIANRSGGWFSAAKGLMGACPHMRASQPD